LTQEADAGGNGTQHRTAENERSHALTLLRWAWVLGGESFCRLSHGHPSRPLLVDIFGAMRPLPALSMAARRWLIAIAALLVTALAAGGSFALGAAIPEGGLDEGSLAPGSEVQAIDGGRVVPATMPVPLRIRTCSVADAALNEDLGAFSGVVVEPFTGDVLFARAAEDLVPPASVMKIVTGVAALTVLGPETRFPTSVVATDDPSRVVLVGGGDSTLSRLAKGNPSVYAGAPTLQDLAEKTIAAAQAGLPEGEKVTITEVVVDASLWPIEDAFDASWSRDAASNGFISMVTALQVDGDRDNPQVELSRRGSDPVRRAGDEFVKALRAAGNAGRYVKVTTGDAPVEGTVLSSVESPPVAELVRYMMKESDNTLAEMLARHVSLAQGAGGTAASLATVIPSVIAGLGLPTEGMVVQDGSGLSPLNQVSPSYIAMLLSEVARGDGPLAVLRDSLPIAGVDGSLDDRFAGENAIVHDRVLAKTGSITAVRSLAGFVTGEDDEPLVFAFFSQGTVGDETRVAIESLVTAVYGCGSNLADF
jgi:serine-type D-Ala-D-Ala carboxypeptidase/endopeptidase (penicillin-binding protein 4)